MFGIILNLNCDAVGKIIVIVLNDQKWINHLVTLDSEDLGDVRSAIECGPSQTATILFSVRQSFLFLSR